MGVAIAQDIISYFFHYVGVTVLSATPDGANFVLTLDADRSIEDQHLQTPIAVDAFYLLPTAVDRKVIDLVSFDRKHCLKGLRGHATEGRPFFVDVAFSGFGIVVDTPAVFTHHAQVGDNFFIAEVVSQVWTIGGFEVTTSPAVFYTLPSCHGETPLIQLSHCGALAGPMDDRFILSFVNFVRMGCFAPRNVG
jgi:hypothetical protein